MHCYANPRHPRALTTGVTLLAMASGVYFCSEVALSPPPEPEVRVYMTPAAAQALGVPLSGAPAADGSLN